MSLLPAFLDERSSHMGLSIYAPAHFRVYLLKRILQIFG